MPYPDTIETLKELKNRGSKIYLLSNAQRCFTQAELEITGIETLLDDVFLSSDHSMKKPEPEFILRLMEKHNMKKEDTVMVGNDTITDIGIAQMVEVDSVLINTFRFSDEYIRRSCGKEINVIEKLNQLL